MKNKALSLLVLSLLLSLPLTSCHQTSSSETLSSSPNEVTTSSSELVTSKPDQVVIDIIGNGDGGEVKLISKNLKIGDTALLSVTINKGYSLAYIKINNEQVRPTNNKIYFKIETLNNKVEVLFEKNPVIMSDFKFEYDDSKMEAKILKYNPDKKIVPYPFIIPEEIKTANKTYKITGLASTAFSASNVEYVILSKNISYIEDTTFCIANGMHAIEVVKDNPYFASFDKCLYSKDFKTLLAVPTSYTCENKIMSVKDGTEVIGYAAFANNRNIEKIILPNSVKTLNKECFNKMSSLITVELSKNIIEIPDMAFYNTVSLISIVIPEGVTTIGEFAFKTCPMLKSVTLPSTLKTIKKEAFHQCQKLENLVLNEGLEYIGNSAFGFNQLLEEVKTPSTLKHLGEVAFESCGSLTKVTLNEGLEYLGGSAFHLNAFLNELVIPSTVKQISYNPLTGCGAATIKVAKGNKHYKVVDEVLYNIDMSELICVPYSFKGVNGKYEIPSTVTKLSYNAIAYNRFLTEVVIPTSVVEMYCPFQNTFFNDSTHLFEMKLVYLGTMEQFGQIKHGDYAWNFRANFAGGVVHCSDGVIALDLQ